MDSNSSRSAALLVALLVTACADMARVPDAPRAAVMLGEWQYAGRATASDAPSLNAGFFVTIAIDSVAGMGFWGRVTSWFAGDVGISPDRLGAVTGAVDLNDGVAFSITQPSHAAVTVMGEIRGDVIVVHECGMGANTGPFPVGGRFQRLH